MTDHSNGHTEEWESLTLTSGATPKRRKTLPGMPLKESFAIFVQQRRGGQGRNLARQLHLTGYSLARHTPVSHGLRAGVR